MGTDARPSASAAVECRSAEDTNRLGRRIGRSIQTPLVLALYGDLGSGKTVLVQGLAVGLGVAPDVYVTSPTYTLINAYAGRLPVYHVDLYRIDDPIGLEEIGLPDLMDRPDGVVAIEWAERLEEPPTGDWVAVSLDQWEDTGRRVRLAGHGRLGNELVNQVAAAM
jgi:tRNA threonylcarbamoyladenosine biosynthesis protein TsaE